MTRTNSSTTNFEIQPKGSGGRDHARRAAALRRAAASALIAAALLGALWLLQRLLVPKYMHGIVEGAMIAEYYHAELGHNVVFIGDCEVYENLSPQVLWDEYGIHSYIRGSAQQLIWQSYYLTEETLRYEHPQIVVFNVLSMKYGEPQSEAYNRMTLDGMKWSRAKLGSVLASMTPEEHLAEYVFPILRYHTRIGELTGDDLTYLFHRDPVTHSGYYMRVDVRAAEDVPEGRPLGNYAFADSCWEYLDRMRELCENNGAELVLIKAPSLYPYWYSEWDGQIAEYARANGLSYYNFLECTEEIGLDYAEDTYDAGLHLNLSGAEKLSRYFGRILREEHGAASLRGDAELEAYWDAERARYEEDRDAQLAALAQ